MHRFAEVSGKQFQKENKKEGEKKDRHYEREGFKINICLLVEDFSKHSWWGGFWTHPRKEYVLYPGLQWIIPDSKQTVPSSHLVVVVSEADADGAAGSGQDSCHSVEVDHHICYSLQDKLFIYYSLKTSVDKNKNAAVIDHFQLQKDLSA